MPLVCNLAGLASTDHKQVGFLHFRSGNPFKEVVSPWLANIENLTSVNNWQLSDSVAKAAKQNLQNFRVGLRHQLIASFQRTRVLRLVIEVSLFSQLVVLSILKYPLQLEAMFVEPVLGFLLFGHPMPRLRRAFP